MRRPSERVRKSKLERMGLGSRRMALAERLVEEIVLVVGAALPVRTTVSRPESRSEVLWSARSPGLLLKQDQEWIVAMSHIHLP